MAYATPANTYFWLLALTEMTYFFSVCVVRQYGHRKLIPARDTVPSSLSTLQRSMIVSLGDYINSCPRLTVLSTSKTMHDITLTRVFHVQFCGFEHSVHLMQAFVLITHANLHSNHLIVIDVPTQWHDQGSYFKFTVPVRATGFHCRVLNPTTCLATIDLFGLSLLSNNIE